jgi:MSHA pilin protein MshC
MFIQPNKSAGFTLVELIMVMVIVGVLAVFVAPRMFDRSSFESRGFADQVQASLRYAQKIAIAQHRFVCVDISNNTLTLNLDTTPISAAHTAATCPAAGAASNMTLLSGGPYSISRPGITLGNAHFNFDALGKPSFATQQAIAISGTTNSIVAEAETGYVHQ